ncbi:armadillo-type protein [Ochromonadaceae sp. CCMP2298]|nr:armadillo-type protein [Ochromonadaceae sp. CCMP2298]|mmetsp:Transcript_33979/g.74842  ORF Transcript_33979/g.74842 Transcript_33979/m.74842 type:complete len:216 (-) Transcript_33979:308-955(-)|eukprot:CAMPEP_0173212524 /NCGR_PEP_ID=MMETSP1141-20130122/24848_1 /TAXON_ID=483371 /ORGANISM="non described non described, Strain CCMP2298" /LENGTH=215 /DNA_ID=CAMNT_0014139553 /DNA_START=55 /DNA_END=702 /DNA_ORIENTATION=+
MDASLAAQLESVPYAAATAVALETYVASQIAEKSYDYTANKALMKNYQLTSSLCKIDFVCKVLILSLMRLPNSDFLSLSYMIPTRIASDPNIAIIHKCANSLERGQFREFWEQFLTAPDLFQEAAGFVDAIRLFIVSNLRDTFKNMPKDLFQQQLGLDENSVAPFCESNKYIDKISGSVIEFCANGENQNKAVRDEALDMDEVIKVSCFLRAGQR